MVRDHAIKTWIKSSRLHLEESRFTSALDAAARYRRMEVVLTCTAACANIPGAGHVGLRRTTGSILYRLKDSSVNVSTLLHLVLK